MNQLNELFLLKSDVTGSYFATDEGFTADKEKATPVDYSKATKMQMQFWRLGVNIESAPAGSAS